MKLLQRLTKSAHFWPIVIVVLLGLLAGRTLLGPGYFNMHDDLQMMRQLEMEKCFLDLQIPCRWVPDMGYGFGFPLFNFYPPLPYLVGEIFRLVGFSFVTSVKLLFVLAFVASGLTMYFLAREFFGKVGGLISSAFYIWAPYHAVDVYVRGAMNEAWALIWFPLILWSAYRAIVDKSANKWLILLSLSFFGLFTSHNLMVLIFTPFFGLWCLGWIVKEKAYKKIVPLFLAGLLSFGLAAFFTLPVIFESGLVHTGTLVEGYYEYVAHFATIKQLLFSRFWGYGPSVWLEGDGMSFQIGQIHWILTLVVIVLAVGRFIKNRRLDDASLIVIFFFIIGWFSAFMAHSRSTFIWNSIAPLKFVQFPWRFLTLVILSFSLVAGYLAKLSKLSIALVVILILFNWNYFLPEHGKLGALTDKEKFSGAAWELQQTAGIYDYLPNDAKEAPKEPRKTLADIVGGVGEVIEEKSGTNWASFGVNLASEGVVRINIFKFAGWKVFVDGGLVRSSIDNDNWGRMHINVPQGEHKITARMYDTWPRTIGNIISLGSWLFLAIYFLGRIRIKTDKY